MDNSAYQITGWPISSRTRAGLTLIWGVPPAGGRYYSYLLPKQGGGTFQIIVNPTQVRHEMGNPVQLLNMVLVGLGGNNQLKGHSVCMSFMTIISKKKC